MREDQDPELSDVLIATAVELASYLTVACGAIFGIALTAASQVWSLPIPRSLFLEMAHAGYQLAMLTGSAAIGLSVWAKFRAHRSPRRSSIAYRLMRVFYLAWAAFAIWIQAPNVERLALSFIALSHCRQPEYAKICVATANEVEADAVRTALDQMFGWRRER